MRSIPISPSARTGSTSNSWATNHFWNQAKASTAPASTSPPIPFPAPDRAPIGFIISAATISTTIFAIPRNGRTSPSPEESDDSCSRSRKADERRITEPLIPRVLPPPALRLLAFLRRAGGAPHGARCRSWIARGMRRLLLLAEVEVDRLAEVHGDDELLLGEGPVRALGRDLDEAAGAELDALGEVGRRSRPEHGGAGDDGDDLARRVGMSGDGESLGELHHHDAGALGGVAALDGQERALDVGMIDPLHLRRLGHDGVLGGILRHGQEGENRQQAGLHGILL